jgi:hypothetical protein
MHRNRRGRWLAGCLVATLGPVIAGCGSSTTIDRATPTIGSPVPSTPLQTGPAVPSLSLTRTDVSTAAPESSIEPNPWASPRATIVVEPIAEPTPRPIAYRPASLEADGFAEILVSELLVREQPFVGPASKVLTGRLEPGDRLFIVAGPVAGSGYAWYRLALGDERGSIGWVAGASKQGEPWLAGRMPVCPDRPVDFETVIGLDAYERLACFGRDDLTLHVIKRGPYDDLWGTMPVGTPGWLNDSTDTSSVGSSSASGELPVRFPPEVPRPPAMHSLTSEPDSLYRVTGHFDDPAAGTCRATVSDPNTGVKSALPVDEQVLGCRLLFVVTSWIALHRIVAGDTLTGIATASGLTLERLLAANPQIADPRRINPGDLVAIPAATR